MSPDQRARALRLADEMERGQTLGYSWGVLDAVALLRELAAEPVRVPMTDDAATNLVQQCVSSSPRPIGMVEFGLVVLRQTEAAHGITGDAK